MSHLFAFLSRQPILLLFLVVAGGYAIGQLKFRGLGLGATAATILLGLGVSLWAVRLGVKFKLPDFAGSLFFNLFIYAIGVRVGPQTTSALGKEGKQLLVIALIISLLSPLLAVGCGLAFHLPAGTITGLLAGANTASPALGGAQAALETGSVRGGAAAIAAVQANLSGSFALTYVINMAGFILFVRQLPRLTRTDAVAAARDFDQSVTNGQAPLPGTAEALDVGYVPVVDIRVFRLESAAFVGESVRALKERYPRVVIERIRRDGKVLRVTDETRLERGDEVALGGAIGLLLRARDEVGPELDDPALRDVPIETAEVVVSKDDLVNRTIGELRSGPAHGLYLNALFRMGESLPIQPSTAIRRGDILRVTGNRDHVRALGAAAGNTVRGSVATDIFSLALGLVVGAALGAITLPILGLRIGLGTTGGVLVAAIAISTVRTRKPELGGPFPEPARQLLEDLGLNVFIAVLGINAGVNIASAMRGAILLPLLASSMVVGFVPAIVAWFVGLKRLRINAAVLLGAVTGGRQCTGAMRATQEVAHSRAPAIGFPVPFAVATIIFTVVGYVFMTLKL